MTFEEFLQNIQAVLTDPEIAPPQPDGDWAPMLFTAGPRGFTYGPMAPALLSLSSVRGQEIPAIVAAVVARTEAQLIATLLPEVACGTRQEVLCLTVGAPERLEFWYAPLQRTPQQPPTLGPWQRSERPEGPFVDALRGAWTTGSHP